MDLHHLITRVLEGNQEAGDELCGHVRQFAWRVLGSLRLRNDADEVLQMAWECLLPAFRQGRPNNRSNRAIVAYIQTTVRHLGLNLIRERRQRRRQEADASHGDDEFRDPLDSVPGHETDPEKRAMLERAAQVIGSWPAADRLIFVRKLYGATAAEIQEDLRQPPYNRQLSRRAIDIRYHRLKGRLKDALDG